MHFTSRRIFVISLRRYRSSYQRFRIFGPRDHATLIFPTNHTQAHMSYDDHIVVPACDHVDISSCRAITMCPSPHTAMSAFSISCDHHMSVVACGYVGIFRIVRSPYVGRCMRLCRYFFMSHDHHVAVARRPCDACLPTPIHKTMLSWNTTPCDTCIIFWHTHSSPPPTMLREHIVRKADLILVHNLRDQSLR